MKKLLTVLLVIGLVFILIPGCSDDDDDDDDNDVPSISGTWNGTWTSGTGLSGTVVVVITQTGSTVSGTGTFNGSPCFSNGTISGDLTNETLALLFKVDGDDAVNLAGTVSGDYRQITGTYVVIYPGPCQGDTGTWTVTKQ